MFKISTRFWPKPIIEFAVGDIVDVNYGAHLPSEISGGHVHSIVCHIFDDNMVYVVPITKLRNNVLATSYLFIDAPQDVTYFNKSYKGGTVLVNKGKVFKCKEISLCGR